MAIGTSDTVAAHGNHRASIEIAAPPELAYALWTRFDQFPSYFRHIESVDYDPQRPTLQHWKGKVHGASQEWDAEISALQPNRLIAWRSINGFANSGSLSFERNVADAFAPNGTTTLTVQIGYDPPRGALGDFAEAVWVKQRFDEGLEEDLSRFKALCEGMHAEVRERTEAGEAYGEVLDSVLRSADGHPEALGSRIQTSDYEMSHLPIPNAITTQELKNRLDWGEVSITILDVRPGELFGEAHIQGASSAPLPVLEERIGEITGHMQTGIDRQIVLYSDREGLSAQAAEMLVGLGYTRVMDYVDGFSAWRATGLPVETTVVGQIIGKGLPEREDYQQGVIDAPTVRDNEVVGGTAAEHRDETTHVNAFGVPGAHLADNSRENTSQQLDDAASHEHAVETLDPRSPEYEAKHEPDRVGQG